MRKKNEKFTMGNIVIEAIKFPSWEEFEVIYCIEEYWSKSRYFMICPASRNGKDLIFVEYHDNNDVPFEYFDFTEQGYELACEWIEKERLKFIKKLCEG